MKGDGGKKREGRKDNREERKNWKGRIGGDRKEKKGNRMNE